MWENEIKFDDLTKKFHKKDAKMKISKEELAHLRDIESKYQNIKTTSRWNQIYLPILTGLFSSILLILIQNGTCFKLYKIFIRSEVRSRLLKTTWVSLV